MASIKITANQEETIEKVNSGLAELGLLNLALAQLGKQTTVMKLTLDLAMPKRGRGKGNQQYSVELREGQLYKSALKMLEAKRESIKKEIQSLTAKNNWLVLSKEDLQVLAGGVSVDDAATPDGAEDDAGDAPGAVPESDVAEENSSMGQEPYMPETEESAELASPFEEQA